MLENNNTVGDPISIARIDIILYFFMFIFSGSQLVSASEDGSVRLWDMRQKVHTNTVQPYLSEKLVRPELGKWIGAACLSEDWLVRGISY